MPRAVKKKAEAAAGSAANKRSKNYNAPEKISAGTVLTDLSKTQWRIGSVIGKGGFGDIYAACRVGEKNYDYALKCEPHGNGPLFVEMHFYMRNAKLEDVERFKRQRGLKALGMPYMVGNGSADINEIKHRFIVMPRYGNDIVQSYVANGHKLPEGTIYRIALQVLDVYEFVHSSGYVHADLKAANLLLGYGKAGGQQIYLVDFGLASHFTTGDFKPDPKKMHNGTIEYTSRDAHQGVPTRRGDFEILGYNIIDWLGVQLPWVRQKLLTTAVKVQQSKEEFMSNVSANLKQLFPKTVPTPVQSFMTYVASLKYDEQPDYNKCRKFFADGLKALKISNSGDLVLSIERAKITTPKTTKQQNKAKPQHNNSANSNVEHCASDDDDDDVLFATKKTVKKAPAKQLKTIPNKTKAAVAQKPVSPLPSKNGASPTSALKKQKLKAPNTPTAASSSAVQRAVGASPAPKTNVKISPKNMGKSKTAAAAKESPRNVRKSKTPPHNSASSQRKTRSSLSSSIDASSSVKTPISYVRRGNTTVNNNTTPQAQSKKVYEVNVELNVSVDADVVVNVNRRKNASKTSTQTSNGELKRKATDALDSPANRPSPSPVVIVKKTKRLI